MNNKGNGLIAMLVVIIGTVASTGAIYGGGNLASSGFFTGVTALTAYSQMPHVVKDFRHKKAVGMCRDAGGWDCVSDISAMTSDEILDYIRDDEIPIAYLNYGYIYTAPADKEIRVAGR